MSNKLDLRWSPTFFLFNIKVAENPLCQLCKVEENITHMLWLCPETSTFLHCHFPPVTCTQSYSRYITPLFSLRFSLNLQQKSWFQTGLDEPGNWVKKSCDPTGTRTQGLWLTVPVLWPTEPWCKPLSFSTSYLYPELLPLQLYFIFLRVFFRQWQWLDLQRGSEFGGQS